MSVVAVLRPVLELIVSMKRARVHARLHRHCHRFKRGRHAGGRDHVVGKFGDLPKTGLPADVEHISRNHLEQRPRALEVARSPATMVESVPALAPRGPPLTGASSTGDPCLP